MNEAEFKSKYQDESPVYEAWGKWVNAYVTGELSRLLGEDTKDFLKIPPLPRLKDVEKLIAKAFYRGKNYDDPYKDITDKIGVRYVVLTTPEIKTVTEIVTGNAAWEYSKDRDFEKEREEQPLVFDYQSDHYIVKNRAIIIADGVTIPVGITCEIQIRTLLQHAYAELTHDTIYKQPRTSAIPEVHRLTAKSMALMEVTDGLFVEVRKKLAEENRTMNILLNQLETLYSSLSVDMHEKAISIFILDAYREVIPAVNFGGIEQFVVDHPFIKENIKEKSGVLSIYKQPVILLLYYLIQTQRTKTRGLWPLTEDELQPLYTDLGIAFDPAY